MQCYHRKLAWLTDGGLVFKAARPSAAARRVSVPCGKCAACRVNNASQWALRTMHEASYVDAACFVTLTYAPEHCPADYGLVKKDLQDFMKRLRIFLDRSHVGHVRAFLACGEYGSKRGRPHYHVCLLGWCPADLCFFGYSYSGDPIYTSATVEEVWGKGFCPVGTLTARSAGYVARYQKAAKGEAGFRPAPFVTASRNIPLSNGMQGALGAQWLIDNHTSLRHGYVHLPDKDVRARIPDYYFDLLSRWYPDEYERIKRLRYDFAVSTTHHVSPIDDAGDISVYIDGEDYEGNPLSHDVINRCLRDFVGVDADAPADYEDLLAAAVRVVRAEAAVQDEKLKKLRRNYE